jgi:hypothetical protein
MVLSFQLLCINLLQWAMVVFLRRHQPWTHRRIKEMSTPWSTPFWIGGCVAAWLLCAVAPVPADTIFTWTDDRGFRHFSDTPPSEATDEPIKVAPPPSTPEADPRRPAYDQMVEEYRREADEMERTRKLEAEKAAAQKEQERRSRRDEKVRSEKND